jgi:tartrate dehydratase beta subunit/fumarate hydratase class I family protein
MAKPAVSKAYRTGLPATSGPIAAAASSAVVDSGPTDSCRLDPSTAYTANAGTAAQSPATGGRPATPA